MKIRNWKSESNGPHAKTQRRKGGRERDTYLECESSQGAGFGTALQALTILLIGNLGLRFASAQAGTVWAFSPPESDGTHAKTQRREGGRTSWAYRPTVLEADIEFIFFHGINS